MRLPPAKLPMDCNAVQNEVIVTGCWLSCTLSKTKRAAPCERGLMRCLRVANARFAGPAEPGPELLLHMAAEIPTSSPNSGHKANTKICGIKGLGGW